MKNSSFSILLGTVTGLLLYYFYQFIYPTHYPIHSFLNVVKLTKSINRFISLEKKADLVGSEHVGKSIFMTLDDDSVEEMIETLSHTDKREVLHSLDH